MQEFTVHGEDHGPIEPAGLDYCRRNGLSTDYDEAKWWIVPDSQDLEEILIIGTTVIWTAGTVLVRAFDLGAEKQKIITAVLTWFSSYESQFKTVNADMVPQLGANTRSQSSLLTMSNALRSTAHLAHRDQKRSSKSSLDRCLVIILDELALMYFVDGRRDAVNLPFRVNSAHSLGTGLMLERQLAMDELPQSFQRNYKSIPTLFYLPDPLEEFGLITSINDDVDFTPDDQVCFAANKLLLTMNRTAKRISLWSMSRTGGLSHADKGSMKSNRLKRKSSIRVSSFGGVKKDDNDYDDDLRHSSVKSDIPMHLDRTVSTDVDPSLMINDNNLIKVDMRLKHLRSIDLGRTSSFPQVFALREGSQISCLGIFFKEEHAYTEFHLVCSGAQILEAQEREKLYVDSVMRFQHASFDYAILATNNKITLRDPFGQNLRVLGLGECKTLIYCWNSQVGYKDSDGSLRRLVIDLKINDPLVRRSMDALTRILTLVEFRQFFATYQHLRASLLLSDFVTFVVVVFSAFLDPSSRLRNVDYSGIDADHQILHLVQEADKFCRSVDMSRFRVCCPQLLLALHFVNMELELDINYSSDCLKISMVLAQLAQWLRWEAYVLYYINKSEMQQPLILDEPLEHLSILPPIGHPPSICEWITATLQGQRVKLQTIELLLESRHAVMPAQDTAVRSACPITLAIAKLFESICSTSKPLSEIVTLMMEFGITADVVDRLPVILALPIRDILAFCGTYPSSRWDTGTLLFLGRFDLVNFFTKDNATIPLARRAKESETTYVSDIATSIVGQGQLAPVDRILRTDHSNITRLLHPNDRRLTDVASMLQYGKPTIVNFDFHESLGEAETIRQQQHLAHITSRRTMSTPTGSAFLSFNSRIPLLTEKFPIPVMNFDVRIKPNQITIKEDPTYLNPSAKAWGLFNCGVAAGLSISRSAKEVSASWIVYNKPEDLNDTHAGFLLGLGLNGHLKAMATWHAFNYLTSKHTMTSIGLLLGLSASFLGTIDVMIIKLLSVHVLALLPPGSNDLNLSDLTQTAGLVGIGLLHYDSGHRRMSEVLLREITVHDHSADSFRDEGYRLAAGIALGMINVSQGSTRNGHRDVHLVKELVACVQGIDREEIDLDNKMPGAMIALGLVFLRTNDEDVAKKLVVPTTQHEIDFFRPDLLLIRVLCKNLILWDSILPTTQFVVENLPDFLKWKASKSELRSLTSEDMNAYNIIAGACLAIGIKHAGSNHTVARDCVLNYLDRFIALSSLPISGFDQKSCRITVRNCVGALCFAGAMIMAGSGDLQVMRRLRRLHHRLVPDIWYGHYMAIEMSLGLLFMSGGRTSLSTSNLAVCSYLAAFYPVLPSSTNDNKSHLQALRHLWVLGSEPRCLVTKDTSTGRAELVPIMIIKKSGETQRVTAPTLLPPLESIASIVVKHSDYWPVSLEFGANSGHLDAFRKDQTLYVTKRIATESISPVSSSLENDNENAVCRELLQLLKIPGELSKLTRDALKSSDPWESQILEARSIISEYAKSPLGSKTAAVEMVLAYWDATTTGFLRKKMQRCERRILDQRFVDSVKLDFWRGVRM